MITNDKLVAEGEPIEYVIEGVDLSMYILVDISGTIFETVGVP